MERLIKGNFKHNRGQLLVEILLAFGLSSILLPALFSGFIAGRSGKVQETLRSQSLAYLKEAEEVVRSVREADWNLFAINGTFHPARQGNAWELAPESEVVDGFTRSIIIADAYRDSADKLIEMFYICNFKPDFYCGKILTLSFDCCLCDIGSAVCNFAENIFKYAYPVDCFDIKLGNISFI